MATPFRSELRSFLSEAADSLEAREQRVESVEPERDISTTPEAPSTAPSMWESIGKKSIGMGSGLSATPPPKPTPEAAPAAKPQPSMWESIGEKGIAMGAGQAEDTAVAEQVGPTLARGTGMTISAYAGNLKVNAHEGQVLSEMPWFGTERDRARAYKKLTNAEYPGDPDYFSVESMWNATTFGKMVNPILDLFEGEDEHRRAMRLVNSGPITGDMSLDLARLVGPERVMAAADWAMDYGSQIEKAYPKTRIGQRIVMQDPGGTLGNAQWWVENAGEQIPMMGSFIAQSLVLGRLMPSKIPMSAAARDRVINAALKGKLSGFAKDLGDKAAKDTLTFFLQTYLPAASNSAMEGGFAYKEAYEKAIAEGMDDQSAVAYAAEKAAKTSAANLPWTWATGSVPLAIAQRVKGWTPKIIDVLMEMVQEVGEEDLSKFVREGEHLTDEEFVQTVAVVSPMAVTGAIGARGAQEEGEAQLGVEDVDMIIDSPVTNPPADVPITTPDQIPDDTPDDVPTDDDTPEGDDTPADVPEEDSVPEDDAPKDEDEDEQEDDQPDDDKDEPELDNGAVAVAQRMKEAIIDADLGDTTPEAALESFRAVGETQGATFSDEDFRNIWDYAKQLAAREIIEKEEAGTLSEDEVVEQLEALEETYPDLHENGYGRPMLPSLAYGLAKHTFTDPNEEILDPMAGTGGALVGVRPDYGQAYDIAPGDLLKHSRGDDATRAEQRDIFNGPDEAQRRSWGQVIVNPPTNEAFGTLDPINVGGGQSYLPTDFAELAIWNALEYMRDDGKAVVIIPPDNVTQDFVDHLFRNYEFLEANMDWLPDGSLMAVTTGRSYDAEALGPNISYDEETGEAEGFEPAGVRINPGFGGKKDGNNRPVGGTRPRPGGVGGRPRPKANPKSVPKPPSKPPTGDGGGTGGGTGGGGGGGNVPAPPRPEPPPEGQPPDGDTPDGPPAPGPDVPGEGEGDGDLPRPPGRKPRRPLTPADRRRIAEKGPWAGREDQQVIASKSMNDEFLELFEFWVELTGYDGKLMIIDIADITNQSQRRREGLAVHGWDMPAQQADELLDPERPSGTVALWYTFSGEVEAREDTEHSFIILNRPETAKSQRFLFELLAHEFGHAIDHRMLTIADDETKEAVREGYENWRKEVEKRANEGMTVREFYNEFMNVGAPRVMAMWRRAGFKRGGELDLPISALNQQFFWDYVAGRNEWMADQAARWLNTQPKALTVLERFWDTLAQALKRFYGWITKHEDIIQWDTETPGETEAGIGEMSKAVSRKRALNRRRDRWFPDKSIQDWLDELAAPFDVRLLDLKGVEGETPAQRRRREFEEFYKKIRERQMDAQKRRDLVRKKRAQDREAAYKKKRVSDDRDGNKYQTPYTPMSENGGEPMLTPTNAAEATRLALVNVVEKHARPILESEGIVVEGDKTGKMSDGQILDRWVRHELGYDTTGRNNLFGTFEDDQAAIDTFEEAFNGHQVDAIALAIAAHRDGGALVLGDQTGAGKGRVVAAFMLYAKMQGQTPVFMTDKVNLFNDMYSDLKDIGVVDPNIFSFNNEVIVDRADETIVRQAPLPEGTHKKVISDLAKSANAVKNFDFVFTTYSQIMNAGSAAGKQRALRKLAHSGTLIALDESHLVSGTGALGRYMQGVIQKPVPENGNNGPAGVLYASATWAKRPDNLMIYARTDMPIATAGNLQDLQRVLHDAGDNMVEVVTGMLAEAGQYLRRERDLDGRSIPPEGEPDSTGEAKAEMGRKADRLNEVLRTMVAFDDAHMYPIKKSFDALVKAVARKKRKSPRMKPKANVAAGRLSSQRFQALNNMLLALKAEGLAKEVIRAWKEDNVKPVIASYHTLTAFTEWYIEEEGLADGDVAENFSYLRTIERVLARSRRVVITDQQGNVTELPNILQPGVFEAWVEKNVPVEEKRDPDNPGPNDKPNLIKEQPFEGDIEFIKRLIERARTEYAATSTTVSTDGKMLEDLPGAPVDYVLTKLRAAGMKVAEITGRAKKAHFEVDYTDPSKPVVRRVDAMSKVEAIAGFNRDDFDAAFLNNAAATGMSMHQKPVAGVHDENNMPKQRWMFILQAAPDISAFMQIIGRVDRLGQVGPAKVRPTDDDEEWGQNNDGIPLYSQWVTPLLTEMRPIQMHMRKLKTLNAGTTASGKSAFDVEEVQNIENEYGDVVVTTYLRVNSDIAAYIRPRLNKRQKEQLADRAQSRVPGISSILTKEMMYLPVEVQARAYSEIDAEYVEHINFLNAIGANELETGVRDLEAETIATDEIAPAMTGTTSPFGRAAIVETVMANKKELPWLVSRITQAMNAEMDKYGIDYSVKQDPQWEAWDTEVFNDPTDPVSGTAAARRSLVGNAVEALDLNNRILRIHNEMLATLEEGEKGNEQVLAELKENKWFYRKALRGRPFEREWTKSIVQALRDGQGVTLAQYFTNPPPENNKAYREYMDHFVEVARTNNQEYAEHMRAVQALPMEDRPETDLDDEKIRTRIERATAVTNALRTIFEATEFSDTRHAQLPVLGAVYEMNLDAITQQDQGVQNTRGVFIGLEYKKDSTRTPEQPPVLSEWSARFAITPSAEQAVVSIKLNSLSQNVNIASWMSYATLGSVREYFESEEAQNAREERYLVTGNLIAGYQAIRAMFNRGRPIVAYFTRKGGEDEQGIIPPKAFDPGNIIVAGPPASGTEDVMKRIEDGQIIRAGDYSLQARMMSKNSYYYKEDDEEVIVRVDARTQASKKRPGGAGARWHLEGKRDGYAKDIKKILQEHYPSTGVKQKSRVVNDFWFPQDQVGREARRAYKEHHNDKSGKHKFNYYFEIRISMLALQDIIAYAYSKGEGFRQMSDSEKEVGSAFYLLPNPNEDPPAFFNFKTEEMSESIERPFWKKKKGPKRGNPKAEDVISDETVHGYVFDKKGRTQQRKEWLERMLKKADNGIWHMASVFGYEAQTMRTKGKRGRPRKYWPDRIRRFYAHTGAAFTEAAVMMEDVLSGLQGHDEYVKWKVYVEMRDLLERAKHHGNHVPMDMTVEAMEQTLEEVVRSMSPQQRRRVTRAVQNYWNMWNKIGEDLAARGKLSKKGQHKTYMPHIVLDYLRAEFSEALPATLRSPFRGYTVKANGSVRPTEDVLEASIRRIGQIKRHNAMDDLIDEFVADFGIKYKRGDTPREGYEFVELHRKRGAYPVMTVTDRGIELATKVGIEAGVEDDLAEQFGRGTPEYEEAMKELKTGMGIATAWLRNNIRSGYWLPTHLAHRVAHWRGDINRGQPFMTMVNKATQMWKAITIVKASLTSAHQVMNFVGDMINVTREDIFAPTEVFRIGVRDPDGNRVTGAIPTLMRAARGKYDQYWREALHEGVITSNWAHEELPDIVNVTRQKRGRLRDLEGTREYNPFRWLTKTYLDLSNFRENIARMALYIRRRKAGDSVEVAAKKAREAPVDYGRQTESERRFFSGMLFPFWTWQANNTINWFKYAKDHPVKFAAKSPLFFGGQAARFIGKRLDPTILQNYVVWYPLIQMLSAAAAWNDHDEERREAEAMLPEWIKDRWHITLGLSSSGTPLALMLSLPQDELLENFGGAALLGARSYKEAQWALWGGVVQTLGELATPWLRVPGEIYANKKVFSGAAVTPRYMKSQGGKVSRRDVDRRFGLGLSPEQAYALDALFTPSKAIGQDLEEGGVLESLWGAEDPDLPHAHKMLGIRAKASYGKEPSTHRNLMRAADDVERLMATGVTRSAAIRGMNLPEGVTARALLGEVRSRERAEETSAMTLQERSDYFGGKAEKRDMTEARSSAAFYLAQEILLKEQGNRREARAMRNRAMEIIEGVGGYRKFYEGSKHKKAAFQRSIRDHYRQAVEEEK